MTPAQWETQRPEFCRLVGKSPDATRGLAQAEGELHTSLSELERLLTSGAGPVRLGKTES